MNSRILRNPTRPPISVVIAVGTLLVLGAVGELPAAAGSARDGTAGDPALAEVLQLVGQASCKDDADCRSLAIGTRACGGPERYLAWSVVRTDAQALAAAADRAAAQQRVRRGKEPNPSASTCVAVADPGARCVPVEAQARRCVLGDDAGAR